MQPLINAYLLNPDSPLPQELASFEALVDALRALFEYLNLERNTIVALNNLRQTTSVAEYHTHFAGHSQYIKIDGNALVPYFHQGLKDTIKDLLTEQKEQKTFEKLQDWTFRLDAHLQARRIEKE